MSAHRPLRLRTWSHDRDGSPCVELAFYGEMGQRLGQLARDLERAATRIMERLHALEKSRREAVITRPAPLEQTLD